MIEVHKLSKQFGKLPILHEVSLSLRRGECIALIGPNGCGKTTLIKSILGMVIPSSGKILFDGKDIAQQYEYRRQIGYMPQIGRYPDNMTIGQVIELIKDIREVSDIQDDELYKAYGLASMLDKKMRTLSGGTTQKVSAMLAFMFAPEVFILDEPTAGLDPVASEILKEKILQEKANRKLILITSHLLSELDDLITQVIFMQDGHIRFHQSVPDLLAETGEQKLSKAIAHYLTREAHA